MQAQILIYGLKQGETRDYMEDLLASNCKTQQDIERVIDVATRAGFHSIRVTTWNGAAPNFAKAVNV